MKRKKRGWIFLLILLAFAVICTSAAVSEDERTSAGETEQGFSGEEVKTATEEEENTPEEDEDAPEGEEDESEEDEEPADKRWTRFEQPFGGNRRSPRMQYWVYTPEDLEPGLPLVIYLHSSFGLNGKALRDALPRMIRDGTIAEPDAVILVPQLPGGYSEKHEWQEAFESLVPIIEKVTQEYEVDETRIALTGYSLGGIGVLDLALEDPGRYDKILCICGKAHYEVLRGVEAFAGTEVMVYTTQGDKTVNPATSITLTELLQAAGIPAYHEEYHSTHGEMPYIVYGQEEVQEWLWLVPFSGGEANDENQEGAK